MVHIAQFSGGKDSTALLLWLREQGIEYTAVFCDTGWEHPFTYAYIEEINERVLGGTLVILKSDKYAGFVDLCEKKGRPPSAVTRFCTEELKLRPFWRYAESQSDEVTSYVGIRADESAARAKMSEVEWMREGGGYWVKRPLLRWTADQVFALTKRHGIAVNPLYLMGAGRVGCWPCVMTNLRELKALLTPEFKERLRSFERQVGRSFFGPRYIPAQYHSGRDPKSGKTYPTCDDVFSYVEDGGQLGLDLATPTCRSIYNLCE